MRLPIEPRAYSSSQIYMGSVPAGVKVVRIILRSDPNQIQILRIRRIIFNIHADMNNPNPIVCGCRVWYGIAKIRRIWIIRKFYVDYPVFRIWYPIISLPRLKHRGIQDFFLSLLLENSLVCDVIFWRYKFWIEILLAIIIYWLITYHLWVSITC